MLQQFTQCAEFPRSQFTQCAEFPRSICRSSAFSVRTSIGRRMLQLPLQCAEFPRPVCDRFCVGRRSLQCKEGSLFPACCCNLSCHRESLQSPRLEGFTTFRSEALQPGFFVKAGSSATGRAFPPIRCWETAEICRRQDKELRTAVHWEGLIKKQQRGLLTLSKMGRACGPHFPRRSAPRCEVN